MTSPLRFILQAEYHALDELRLGFRPGVGASTRPLLELRLGTNFSTRLELSADAGSLLLAYAAAEGSLPAQPQSAWAENRLELRLSSSSLLARLNDGPWLSVKPVPGRRGVLLTLHPGCALSAFTARGSGAGVLSERFQGPPLLFLRPLLELKRTAPPTLLHDGGPGLGF